MRKASRLLFLLGAIFGLVTLASIVSTALFLATGGTIAGVVLLIIGATAYDGWWIFFEIGLPIWGGTLLGAIMTFITATVPALCLILGILGAVLKKGPKPLLIIELILAALMLVVSSDALIPALLLLIAAVLGLSEKKEEPKEVVEEEQIEEVK